VCGVRLCQGRGYAALCEQSAEGILDTALRQDAEHCLPSSIDGSCPLAKQYRALQEHTFVRGSVYHASPGETRRDAR